MPNQSRFLLPLAKAIFKFIALFRHQLLGIETSRPDQGLHITLADAEFGRKHLYGELFLSEALLDGFYSVEVFWF
jgi:hypothetical protein